MKSMIRIVPLIAMSLITTGCATALANASGNTRDINTPAEKQALLERSGVVIVGPRAHQESIRNLHMRNPIPMVTSEPTEEQVERMGGAALVPTTVIITYADGSSEFRPTGAQVYHMSLLHKRGPTRIEFRGRVSNEVETPGSVWMAKERAENARRYYYGHGFSDVEMSINYRGSGDFAGDPRTESGRKASRRVEIQYFFEGS